MNIYKEIKNNVKNASPRSAWDKAERLCTPSEFKRNRGGELPESPCYWIRTQGRALKQASRLILNKFRVLQSNISKATV